MRIEDIEFTQNTLVEEQETTINHLKEDDSWYIYTCERTMLTRLKKILKYSDDYEIIRVTPRSVQLKLFVPLLINTRKKRDLSDEDREILSQRAKDNFSK